MINQGLLAFLYFECIFADENLNNDLETYHSNSRAPVSIFFFIIIIFFPRLNIKTVFPGMGFPC